MATQEYTPHVVALSPEETIQALQLALETIKASQLEIKYILKSRELPEGDHIDPGSACERMEHNIAAAQKLAESLHQWIVEQGKP